MPVAFRSELDPLSPYKPPRAANEASAERGADGYVKLTSNELSFGPLPEAEAALAEALPRANRYPDRYAASLREEVVRANPGSAFGNILVGNGSSEILLNLLQLVERPGEVIFPWPSFGLYASIGTVLGLRTTKVPLTEDHEIEPEALLSSVTDETRAVIVSNPNNPTGTYLTFEEVRALAEALPENVLLILDEAYQEFVSDPAYAGSHVLALEMENVVCVRTFSKAHGLAGFRVGYGIAGREGGRLRRAGPFPLLGQPRRPGGRRRIYARRGQDRGPRPLCGRGAGQDPGRLRGGRPELRSLPGQLRPGTDGTGDLRAGRRPGARRRPSRLPRLEPGDGR